MTAQAREKLLIDGKEHGMCATPLEPCLQLLTDPDIFRRQWRSTACRRGYIGTWEINDKKLWLLGLRSDSYAERLEKSDPLDVGLVCPGRAPPIFADWFSGKLRVPMGKRLVYVHLGWGSIYERELVITVEKGRVLRQRKMNTEARLEQKMKRDAAYRAFLFGLDVNGNELPVPPLTWLEKYEPPKDS